MVNAAHVGWCDIVCAHDGSADCCGLRLQHGALGPIAAIGCTTSAILTWSRCTGENLLGEIYCDLPDVCFDQI